MATSLILRRLHRLPPNLPLNLSLLFSTTTTTQAPHPISKSSVDYLIQSCSDDAIQESKKIQRFRSSDSPDAVLRFLRQAGISESDIRSAVSRDPRLLLCSNVKRNLRPNIAKLQELGFSTEDISGLISITSHVFRFNIVRKVDFWIQALGSVENASFVLKKRSVLLCYDLEKCVVPNISFLKEECRLSVCQIVKLITMSSRLIQHKPEFLMMKAKRADELGVARGSPMFLRALTVVGCLSESTIDAKLLLLRSFGFSHEEVNTLIRTDPLVLMISEESMGRKVKFLINEAGCNNSDVVHNPTMLQLSLEKRLIPRNLVQKLLKLKGLPVANQAFTTFVLPSEKRFLEKFVLPYEDTIPELHKAYTDACAGKTVSNE